MFFFLFLSLSADMGQNHWPHPPNITNLVSPLVPNFDQTNLNHLEESVLDL